MLIPNRGRGVCGGEACCVTIIITEKKKRKKKNSAAGGASYVFWEHEMISICSHRHRPRLWLYFLL